MKKGTAVFETLGKRGVDFLGSKYPIICGAMSWVSDYHLVAAVSNAGGFGVIAGGMMTCDLLKTQIQQTKKSTKNPFAVNLMTMHPDMEKLIAICAEEKVSHVVFAGALPKEAWIKQAKEGGMKVMCFAPAAALAKRLMRAGADAFIIEGMESGGHLGPIATTVLMQEVMLPLMKEIPFFVAGGIATGRMVATMLRFGAAGCQLGTRFVVAEECIAHLNMKNAYLKASSRDAVASVQIDSRFPVIPVRSLQNEACKKFMDFQRHIIEEFEKGAVTFDDARIKIEHFWAGALKKGVIDGDIENGSIMAGQSVGMVKKIEPAQAIIDDLVGGATDTFEEWAQ